MDPNKLINTAAKNASAYLRKNGIAVDISPADVREIKNDPPPKKIDFPTILFICVLGFEVVDIIIAFFAPIMIVGVGWRFLRICMTGYLYIWAIQSIQGINAVGLKRLALKKARQRAALAALANLPIPIVGDILGVLPLDVIFILLTYNSNSKIVQALWAVIEGDFKKLNISVGVKGNITRSRRGPELQITQRTAGDKSQDGLESKQSASTSGLSKQDSNLDLRKSA